MLFSSKNSVMSCWSEVTRWRWHVAVITFLNKHHNFCQNFWRINCQNICIDIELKPHIRHLLFHCLRGDSTYNGEIGNKKPFCPFTSIETSIILTSVTCLQCDCQRQQTDCYKSYSHFVIWSTFAVILKFCEKVWIFHFIGFILQKASCCTAVK